MKLRLIPLSLCLLLSVIAVIFFGTGAIITSSTKAENALVWTRPCTIAIADETAVTVNCGTYTQRTVASSIIVAAIPPSGLPIKCKGYESRGVVKQIILDCEK